MLDFDASQWPLVIDTLPGQATDDSVRAYIDRHRGYLARGEVYGAVLDIRRAELMGAKHRRMLADWLLEQRVDLMDRHAAVAIVVSSPLVRGFVSAVYWLSPPPYPYKVTSTFAEAKEWVSAHIVKKQRAR